MLLVVAVPAAAQQSGTGVNYETRLSNLEDQMRATNGQIEQLGYSIRRLDQNVQKLSADDDGRLTRLETSVNALITDAAARAAAPPVPPPTAPQQVTGSLGGAAPPLPDVPVTDTALTPQEQYDHALGLLRQANYEDAGKEFQDFITANPKDKLVEFARFWFAETLYGRGHFADASTAYAEAYKQNPQGSKAPESLLKIAMSQAALGKPANACTVLSELRTEYPNATSTVKNRAAEQRTKLKCN